MEGGQEGDRTGGKWFSVPVSENGFSKYSGRDIPPDATARNSPSGLIAGFWGHPCPQIAVC